MLQYLHGGGASRLCTSARPDFVQENYNQPKFRSSLGLIGSSAFFLGNSTTARPSQSPCLPHLQYQATHCVEDVLKSRSFVKKLPTGAAGGFPVYTKFTDVACLPIKKRPSGLSRSELQNRFPLSWRLTASEKDSINRKHVLRDFLYCQSQAREPALISAGCLRGGVDYGRTCVRASRCTDASPRAHARTNPASRRLGAASNGSKS